MVDIILITNMNIINKLTFITATFIAGCVLLVSIHAKDIVKYTDTSTASRVVYNDISKKAVGELHDHVDKQVVKSLVKTFDKSSASDNYVSTARSRQDIDTAYEEDPGLWGRLREAIMIWHVYASLPFAVS